VVLDFHGEPRVVLAQMAPLFPYMIPEPYCDENDGIYMYIRILLPSAKTKYTLAVAKDGNAVELTWFWPKSFQSDKQCVKEPGLCELAKKALKDTIARFQKHSNDFSTKQRYPLPMTVLLVNPLYTSYTTADEHTYTVAKLIVKMPDWKNKRARTILSAPDASSDEE
jgi:hypothetical protein